MTKIKSIILGLISLIVLSILLVTWFYPFSTLSVYKSYVYQPDSELLDSYVKDIDKLEELTGESSKDDLTSRLVQNFLGMYKQDWLISKDSVRMNRDKLDTILFKVKNGREHLLKFTLQENYTYEQRTYLLDSIRKLLSIEGTIVEIRDGNWESRSEKKGIFHILQEAFNDSLIELMTFYEATQTT